MLHSALDSARAYGHVYLAPHPDDAALSCGGQIAQLVDQGARVLVVTLCAGDPPADAPLSPFAQYLHREWGLGHDPLARRRAEDAQALTILGCDGFHLDQLDAPYRAAAYGVGDGWRGAIMPDDPLIAAAATILTQLHAQQPDARFYVPLGVGNHVDHQIVCATGLRLYDSGADVAWYEDAPYAAKAPEAIAQRLAALPQRFVPDVIDIGSSLDRKLRAIAAYDSQQRELFGDADMREVMTTYAAWIAGKPESYGERLWRRVRM